MKQAQPRLSLVFERFQSGLKFHLEPGQKNAVDGSEIYLFLCLRTKSLLKNRVGRKLPNPDKAC